MFIVTNSDMDSAADTAPEYPRLMADGVTADASAGAFPRAQVGANSQRLLAAILADYTFESADRFSSQAITRILAEFGVTEAGARKALSRLTERKVLVRSKVGRGTFYRVSEANLAVRLARRRRYLSFGERATDWDGSWTVVVFSVAERERSVRAALRSGLTKAGFASMADAVWVHPGDARADANALIRELGAHAAVMAARFDDGGLMNPADAYDLSTVRALYEELIAQHEPIVERMRRGTLAPAEAFVLRARLMDSWRSVVIEDPDLPSELLPPDWPRSRARVLFLELIDGLGPLALERLKGLVAESDPEGASRLAHHLLAGVDAELAVGRDDVPSAAG